MICGSGFCSSFKGQLLAGFHHLDIDQLFLALYTDAAPLSLDTTETYAPTGEVAALGYTAGGQLITGAQLLGPMARTFYLSFDDVVWPASSIQARGGLIYNQSYLQAAVAILDFGADQFSNQGDFRVKFPPPGPFTALIRIL